MKKTILVVDDELTTCFLIENFLSSEYRVITKSSSIEAISLLNDMIPDLIISEITTAKDIDAWNSLNHMSLISEIEKQFKIQFDFFEVMDFENIDELLKSIENKI